MTLSPKQRAALNRAPPAQKIALERLYKRQQDDKDWSKRGWITPPRANRQGPANPRKRPLGGESRVPRPLEPPMPTMGAWAFDAFDKRHLPLDEVTAPYTATNFTSTMDFQSHVTEDRVIVVAPRTRHPQESFTGPMTDVIAIQYNGATIISNAMANQKYLRSPIINEPPFSTDSTWTPSSVRARLHNLTVKVECLGVNTGLYPPGGIYIGTVPALETGSNSSAGHDALTAKTGWAMDAIQVGYLRSVPAAKLVQKPVYLSSSIAENISYKSWRDMVTPPQSQELGGLHFSTALEPIIIYIPKCGANTTAVDYRLVVGQQWCHRHPNNILMRATQKDHKPTSPDMWHKAISSVQDIGAKLMNEAGGAAVDALSDWGINKITTAMKNSSLVGG